MKKLSIATLALTLVAGAAVAATPSSDTAAQAAGKAQKSTASPGTGAAEVRSWGDVDKNRDNLVTPQEMEAYLQANPGPLRPRG